MSAFDFPVIDGFTPSWADIALRVTPTGGTLIEIGDVSAISGSWSVELGEQREGGRVIKRTTGSVSYEASMTLYASGYQKLIRGLRAQALLRGNQRRISLVTFGINLQWTPPNSVDILQRRYKGCRLIGTSQDSSEGNDAQQFELPMSVIEIVDVVDGEEIAAL